MSIGGAPEGKGRLPICLLFCSLRATAIARTSLLLPPLSHFLVIGPGSLGLASLHPQGRVDWNE